MALVLGMVPATASAASLPPGPRLTGPDEEKVVKYPNLRWKPVSGASQYEIQVAQDSRFANITETITTAANQFIDTEQWPSASYWWRVRAIAPFRTQWSEERKFTQRWRVPDVRTGDPEIARPDKVTVEDVSTEPGIQAATNRIHISWEPVANASYYEIVMTSPKASTTCYTPHTALTPGASVGSQAGTPGPISAGGPGLALVSDGFDKCLLPEGSSMFVKVRALAVSIAGITHTSLWSDEARGYAKTPPGPVAFTIEPMLAGVTEGGPARLTAPSNGARFTDSPVLTWDPVIGATGYTVVIALDRDFTTLAGTFSTTNTRLIPTERFPEDNALRAYYWYVQPCRVTVVDGREESVCTPTNQMVNREGAFRSFKKLSPRPQLGAEKQRGPWTRVEWASYASTAMKINSDLGRPADSIGGIDWYEVQIRVKGQTWPGTSYITDLPSTMQNETTIAAKGPKLAFGQKYQWRIRVVDGSNQPRPWSKKSDWTTPFAQPRSPVGLTAKRQGRVVRLDWRAPKPKYFPAEAYRVFYSTNAKRWKPLNTVKRTSAKYKVSPKRSYWFAVSAISRGGEGRPTEVFVRR